MKYYLLTFYQLIKKSYILVFSLFISLYIILFLITMNFSITMDKFNILLGCPPFQNVIQILWAIFQISCHVYIVYLFFIYESDSSYEYIILRESYEKSIIKKFILIILITLLIRIIIFFGTYLFFYKHISFPIQAFKYNIIVYILVSIITTIVTFFVRRD